MPITNFTARGEIVGILYRWGHSVTTERNLRQSRFRSKRKTDLLVHILKESRWSVASGTHGDRPSDTKSTKQSRYLFSRSWLLALTHLGVLEPTCYTTPGDHSPRIPCETCSMVALTYPLLSGTAGLFHCSATKDLTYLSGTMCLFL
jgi:hypothetical protein